MSGLFDVESLMFLALAFASTFPVEKRGFRRLKNLNENKTTHIC